MAKRGRRRKRLYTPSRYKRTSRAQNSKASTSVSLVQEADEDPNEGEDVRNQEVEEPLGTEAEDDDGFDERPSVGPQTQSLISSSISCPDVPASTFNAFNRSDVDTEDVGMATDAATSSNKILFMAPKRPLLSGDQPSSVANKKLRMNTVNQPTATEQILTSASAGSKLPHQHVHPQSSIAVVNNDVFMLNVSQTTVKNISPISSPPPLGQLFFQRTPVTSVDFPQAHGPVVSFSNEVVPTHFSDEREVQLHIEEDDAVNLSEQYSILDEIEAGDQGTNSISTETGQPLSVAPAVSQTIVDNSTAIFSTISTPTIPHSNVINIVHSSGNKPLLLTTPDSVTKQQVSVSNSPLVLKPFVQSPPVCEAPVMINYSPSARSMRSGSLDQNLCGGRANLVLTTPVLAQPSSSIISFSGAGALQQPLLNTPILVNSPIASQKVITVGASSIPSSSSVVVGNNTRAINDTVSSPATANTLSSSETYVLSSEGPVNVTNQDVQVPGFTESETKQEDVVPSSDPYVIATEIPVTMVSQNIQFPELSGNGIRGENPEYAGQSSLLIDQKVNDAITTTGCGQIHVVDAPAGIIRIDQAVQRYDSSKDQACVTVSSKILSPSQLHQRSSDRENDNGLPMSLQSQNNKYLLSQNAACASSNNVSWESHSNFIAEPVEIMSQGSCDNQNPSEQMLQSEVSSLPVPLLSNGNEETKSENNASPNCVTAVGASGEESDSVNDANGTSNDRPGLGDLFDQPKEEEYEEDIDVKSCDDDSDAQNLTADNEQILSGDAQLKSVASLLNMLHEGNEQQQELLEQQQHADETADTFGESDYGKAGGVHSKSLRLLKMKLEEGENPEFDLGNLQRRRRIAFTPRQYKLLQTTFEHNNFPEPSEQRSISLQLGAPYRSIKMWFQNKRAAVRKRLGPDAPRAAGSPRTKYKNASDANSCFYCDLCPAAFIALPFLKRHKEYHQIKTFHCPDCNAAFTHPDLLMTHSRAKCRDPDKHGDPCARSASSEAKKLRAELRLKLNRSMTQNSLDAGVGDLDAGTVDTDDGSEIEVVDLCDMQESSKSYQNNNKKLYQRPLSTTVLNVPRLQSLKFLSAVGDNRVSRDHDISFSGKDDAVPVQQSLTNVNDRGLVPGLHNFGSESIDENIDGLKILAEQCLVHASNSESSSLMNQPMNLHKPRVDPAVANETSQVDNEELDFRSTQLPHDAVSEIPPHNSFCDKPAESDHDERNLVEGAKIQARVTMLPISAAGGLGGESVPLFARSLPLIAALQQISRANAEQCRDEPATDINSQDQATGGNEQDSGEEEQDFRKLQCSSSPQVVCDEGDISSSVSDNHRALFSEQPDVRSQLLQQAFLNQIKQQQKHEQSQILHKLSKLYAGTSASVKEQEREVAGRNFDSGGEIISSSPDLTIRRQEPSMTIKNEMNVDKDEANQLKFGNLTIYPIKCKTKTEAPQPIDLSSRSGSLEIEKEFPNTDASLKTNEESMNEPRQQLLNTFHQNLLKILAGQSSAGGLQQPLSDGGGSSEQAANSLALLPFLAGSLGGLAPNAVLQTLLNANILLNAATNATANADSLAKAPGLEQDADAASQRAIKERIFSALLSQLINKNAGSADDKTPSNSAKLGVESDNTGKQSVGGSVSTTTSSGGRPQRRRTTVFSESQHRILYQHFTHCNFPEPAMFRILAKLIGLDAAVIKIWFQNERSRQRKRASFIMEGNKSFADKPYKCMDCDMSFAMATFLVKHSARHSLHDQSQNKTRTCPICSLRFETDAYNEHLRSVHQVDMMLEEVKPLDEKEESENLTCYLCQKIFDDPEALFIHKKDHLTSRYGSVASCSICDSSFVNAICLEAHMQTHYKLDWSYECSMCRSRFPEEILLKSHTMSHGIPAPAISSVNRYRSQTQEGQKKCTSSGSQASLHPNVDLTASNSSDNSRSNHVDDGAKGTAPDMAQRKSFMEALQIGSTRHDDVSSGGSTSATGLQVPIQISTSQVTTTQAGTPLAIRTTDAEGRSVIQLLPVQLIPAAQNTENDDGFCNLFNNSGASESEFKVHLRPKTKKKIPDLIPISEYQSAAQKLKDQFNLGSKSVSVSNEGTQSCADSILKSYITGALPRSSGAFGCSTVNSSHSRPKLQDGFEKPSSFPSLVKIESGLSIPVDSNIGSTGKDSHVTFSVHDSGSTSNSGLLAYEGVSRTSHPSLTSPGSVRVVDSSHLTSQSSDNASYTDEHSKLFTLLSQGLNLSKVTNGCRPNECGNSDDEMQDEVNVGRCAADSDATASDDELVIDLKEGNESQESENEDSKEVAFKVRESAGTVLDSGNGKLNAQVLRGLNLDSLNGNEEFKKYFLETIQKMMRLREDEMTCENEKDYEPLSPQNDDGCSVLGDGNVEYRDSSNVGREGSKPEEHLESKKYRNRREYTQDEQLILLAHFQHNHFPPTRELKLLAKRLNITHRQIMHWFQNRRSKERKSLPYSRRVSRQCSECKATFVHDEGLASHKAVSHDPSSVAVQFGCPVKSCMMSFPSEVLLQTHELLHDRRDGTVRKGFPDLDAMTVKKARRILPKKLQMEGQGPARVLKLPGLSSSSCSPYTSPLASPPLPSFLSLKSKLPNCSMPLSAMDSLALPSLLAKSVDAQQKSSVETGRPSVNSSKLSTEDDIPGIKPHVGLISTASDVPENMSLKLGADTPGCESQVPTSFGHLSPVAHIINKLQLKIESEVSTAPSTVMKGKTCPRWSLKSPDSTVPPLLTVSSSSMTPPAVPKPVAAATTFGLTPESLSQLLLHFEENNFPSPQELSSLSRQFGLDAQSLSAWYKTRRRAALPKEGVDSTCISSGRSPSLSGGSVVCLAGDSEAEQTCPMCSAGFVTKRDLQQHIRLHSDPAAFTCDVCHAVFRYQTVHASHVEEHTMSASTDSTMSTSALLAVRSPPSGALKAKCKAEALDDENAYEVSQMDSVKSNAQTLAASKSYLNPDNPDSVAFEIKPHDEGDIYAFSQSQSSNKKDNVTLKPQSRKLGSGTGSSSENCYDRKSGSSKLISPKSKVKYKSNPAEKLVCRRSSSGSLIISKLSIASNSAGASNNKRSLSTDETSSVASEPVSEMHNSAIFKTIGSPTSTAPKFRTVFALNDRPPAPSLNGVRPNEKTTDKDRLPVSLTSPTAVSVTPRSLSTELPKHESSSSDGTLKLALKLSTPRPDELATPSGLGETDGSKAQSPDIPALSGKQLKILEIHYESNNLPRGPELRLISRHTSVPVSQIVRWYSARRQQERYALTTSQHPVSRVQCPHCNSCFISKVNLVPHLQMHISVQESGDSAENACTTCGAHFPDEILLKTHLFCHGAKAFKLYMKKKKSMNLKEQKRRKNLLESPLVQNTARDGPTLPSNSLLPPETSDVRTIDEGGNLTSSVLRSSLVEFDEQTNPLSLDSGTFNSAEKISDLENSRFNSNLVSKVVVLDGSHSHDREADEDISSMLETADSRDDKFSINVDLPDKKEQSPGSSIDEEKMSFEENGDISNASIENENDFTHVLPSEGAKTTAQPLDTSSHFTLTSPSSSRLQEMCQPVDSRNTVFETKPLASDSITNNILSITELSPEHSSETPKFELTGSRTPNLNLSVLEILDNESVKIDSSLSGTPSVGNAHAAITSLQTLTCNNSTVKNSIDESVPENPTLESLVTETSPMLSSTIETSAPGTSLEKFSPATSLECSKSSPHNKLVEISSVDNTAIDTSSGLAAEASLENLATNTSATENSLPDAFPFENSMPERTSKISTAPSAAPSSCEEVFSDDEGEPLPEGEALDTIITTYTISQYMAEEEKQHQA